MRAAMEMGTQIPKLCATDMLDAFGSCRLCLVEIQGRNGTPASCTTPVAEGMVVHTQTDRLKRLRKGVMELYISEHPLDCLTCSANGDCELQDMAGAVGLREVRYGYDGAAPPQSRHRRLQPLFHLRAFQMHRLLALRAGLRGGARHLRADHRRPRLRLRGLAVAAAALHRFRMRVVRRLRPGLPHRDAEREERDRDRHARAFAWSPPAPIAASAAPSRPRCAATSWCAWCRGKTARPIAAIPASRAASPSATPRIRTAS